MTERLWYRCCEHCPDDPIHDLGDDPGHTRPCNAANSRDCDGRKLVV